MKNLHYPQWVRDLDTAVSQGIPSLAIVAFDRREGRVFPVEDCFDNDIHFDFDGKTNVQNLSTDFQDDDSVHLQYPDREEYAKQFEQVMAELLRGNTYLINLCTATNITGHLDFRKIFHLSDAKFKLFFRNQFVVFSPERFVSWKNGLISTHPMKGTIDAGVPGAEDRLRGDKKERAEHATIVDLLRNDLGIVCDEVWVERYGYIESVTTSRGPILQMSSEIVGRVAEKWMHHPGRLFYSLLPAGSVSGAPKKSTVDIINRVESTKRGYYTGIAIYYDGKSFDSAVMIRFIENRGNALYHYRSGGGVTHMSQMKSEYDEVIRKVYLPFL